MKKYLLLMLMGTVLVSGSVMAGETAQQEVNLTSLEQVENEKGFAFGKKRMHKDPEKMRENFVKKLSLTEEQQEKASAIHQKSKAEMEDIKNQIKTLRERADTIRENNKKEFESLLTDEQKKTLEQMHQERKDKMKHHYKKMHNKLKNKGE